MRTLIKNVHVLTMSQDHIDYPNGYVLIKEDKISQVGSMNQLEEMDVEEIIDGKDGILIPGFINTHTHVGMIPFRSLGDDTPDRLRRFLFPLEQHMTRELVRASSEYAMAEMLLSGTTSFADMYYFEEEIAQACTDMGMRGLLGQTIIDMKTCDAATVEEQLLRSQQFIELWSDHDLITPMIAPHAPNTNTMEDLKKVVELSRSYETPVMMHVSEMTYEQTEIEERYDMTPVELLASLGLFDQRFILAHGILLSESDISCLSSYSDTVGIAHCIGANTKSAKGVAPIKALLDKGVSVGLGTDGPSSGNTLDQFTQMKLMANFHKTHLSDRSAFPSKEILRLATHAGAEVLGISDKVGSIEVGKQADLVLVETSSVNMFPVFDPYSVLVYSANASNVSHTWVNGRLLVANKQLVNVSLSDLRKKLESEMIGFREAVETLK